MNAALIQTGWMLLIWLCSSLVLAMSIEEPLQVKEGMNWVFSGMVTNEQAERYGYYFELQRKGEKFRILSALVNMEKKSLVFVEENEANVQDVSGLNWQVGHSYLGFNPETHRLSFGVKNLAEQGFSFKIDTLAEPISATHPQILRTGLALNVMQMGRVNGHIYLGKDHVDEFVTAKQTWFRQLTTQVHGQTEKNHNLTNVLCQFDDGSGFYAANMPTSDALRGFVAGWRDPAGKPVKMSQFVKITQDIPHEWNLSASFPAFHVRFSDLLDKQHPIGEIAAGIVVGDKSGFCTAGKELV
jgi:hypothetical protein